MDKSCENLARKHGSFETYFEQGQKFVRFRSTGNQKEHTVKLPLHHIDFEELLLTKLDTVSLQELETNKYIDTFISHLTEYDQEVANRSFQVATISTSCPKGTYIRQLAEDIGNRMSPPMPAMLIGLRRTRVGEAHIDQAISIEDLSNL